MEVQQLRHLLAAVQFGNLARAAEETDISQSGLSRSIKSLETRLGVQLLVRGPAGVEPTEFGLGLIERARVILNEISRAKDLLREIEAGEVGEITIGATHNYAHFVLPEVIAKFAGERRQAKIHIVTGSFPELIDGMKVGRMDFAIALLGPISHGDELVVEPLGFSHARVLARAGHPLVNKAAVSVPELAAAHWALLDSGSLQQKFATFFSDRRHPTPRQVLQTSSVVLLKKALLKMDALTVLPLDMVRDELASGEFCAVNCDTPSESARVGLIFRANSPMSPQIAQLVAEIRGAAIAAAAES